MKFICEKSSLQNAIATVSRAAAGRSPIPALEGILIEASQSVRMTGYDLKKGIYTSVEAEVAEPGSIVLGARLFGEIARSLPEGTVTITANMNNMAVITCGKAEFSIMGTDPADYPELPDVDYRSSVTMSQKIIKKMIAETIFAVSDNESRPIYTGSLFEIKNGYLTLVSVDGYRLAMRRERIEASDEDESSFVVPGASLSELEKICLDEDEPVKITVGDKHISFSIGDTILISRRLEGEFINYRKSIPEEFSIKVKVYRTEFLHVVDRVSLIIDDRVKNPLRCIFDDNEIKFSCVTALGKAEDACSMKGTGGGMEIGFNNRYLRDALKVSPADELKICLNSGSSPCVIIPEEEGRTDFLYMILPVRLRSGDL